ncbi:HAD hydrolase-like protein [Agromyces aerolatus]|uniref:HAD hydrolase-like protein n=1 Tax=Agromyces sp. LY-1074 TaxID=3074080 RepID=UPI002860F800|nr:MULTISPECIES: HAD hydrolase-like protein [unclassified Agromyces]MDR5701664.1 HAD hydrolase-like protein [Agromyces sp. LY-1074]MDR5707896.1 HAD hydrolase-like protein [Agromyces sp. LY-1358]
MTSTLPTRPVAAPPRTWSAVLFDLDGTIVDSEAEITRSLAHTFSSMGVPVPDAETLRSYVGPPLLDSLRMTAGFTDADAWEALNVYRDHYDVHLLNSPVFPGVAGVLERLHAAGVPVALATSKPESMARDVLEHNDLAKYFTVIAGASEDEERSTKADVVREALARLDAQGVDTTEAVMVGDRGYDTLGALANGVPTIMVEWGYGSPAEAGDAFAVVHSADQLRNLLLG